MSQEQGLATMFRDVSGTFWLIIRANACLLELNTVSAVLQQSSTLIVRESLWYISDRESVYVPLG